MKILYQKITGRFDDILNDHSGAAAIEFAMVLPLLVILLLGTFELGQAYTVDRRVTLAASSAADLVSQGEQIDDAGLTTIMNLADSILAPYNANALSIDIISVVADAQGNTTVGWSYSKGGGQPYAAGSSYPMTGNLANLITPTSSVIIAKANYTYTPVIGKYLLGGVQLKETFYLRPRKSLLVQKL